MHVVEPEHDRLDTADLFEQRRDLALQPFLGAAGRLRRKPGRRESLWLGGTSCEHQLGASARIKRDRLPRCSLRCRLSSASRTGR